MSQLPHARFQAFTGNLIHHSFHFTYYHYQQFICITKLSIFLWSGSDCCLRFALASDTLFDTQKLQTMDNTSDRQLRSVISGKYCHHDTAEGFVEPDELASQTDTQPSKKPRTSFRAKLKSKLRLHSHEKKVQPPCTTSTVKQNQALIDMQPKRARMGLRTFRNRTVRHSSLESAADLDVDYETVKSRWDTGTGISCMSNIETDNTDTQLIEKDPQDLVKIKKARKSTFRRLRNTLRRDRSTECASAVTDTLDELESKIRSGFETINSRASEGTLRFMNMVSDVQPEKQNSPSISIDPTFFQTQVDDDRSLSSHSRYSSSRNGSVESLPTSQHYGTISKDFTALASHQYKLMGANNPHAPAPWSHTDIKNEKKEFEISHQDDMYRNLRPPGAMVNCV